MDEVLGRLHQGAFVSEPASSQPQCQLARDGNDGLLLSGARPHFVVVLAQIGIAMTTARGPGALNDPGANERRAAFANTSATHRVAGAVLLWRQAVEMGDRV